MNIYKFFAFINTLGLVAVLTVNYLANALPINGKTTGELSDAYPNVFVPAGLTFSIWGNYLFISNRFCGLSVHWWELKRNKGASFPLQNFIVLYS